MVLKCRSVSSTSPNSVAKVLVFAAKYYCFSENGGIVVLLRNGPYIFKIGLIDIHSLYEKLMCRVNQFLNSGNVNVSLLDSTS